MNSSIFIFSLIKSYSRQLRLLKTDSKVELGKSVKTKKVSHKLTVQKFFLQNQQLASIAQHIPEQYLSVRRYGTPNHLYLICPSTAKIIASHVKTSIESNRNQVIAETNAGLGLISSELLESGINPVRLYELCPYFKKELLDFGAIYPGQVELFIKDLFQLYRYAFMDKQDRADRVKILLKNVPRRNWADETVMTVIGTMSNLSFLRFLIKCICLQNSTVIKGRYQIFALMRPRHYAVINSTPQDNQLAYQYWTVLFNLFMDFQLLEKFPRQLFLPWEFSLPKTFRNRYPANLEPDKMYLVKMNFKRELPVSAKHLLPLFYLGKHFYGRGSNKVIPTIEKWVPGCGLNILLPKLKHTDYYEDINIFTKFRELTPSQILAVFKEIVNYPTFVGSSYAALVENELIKQETVETDLAEADLIEKNVEDIEEKLDS